MTAAQATLTLAQIGRQADDPLGNLIPAIEEEYAEKAALSPRLVPLYVKRELIDVLLGGNWGEVNRKEGDEQSSDSDKSAHLHTMREAVQTQIDRLEKSVTSCVVASGQLSTQATIAAPPFGPDPNDARYAGDPLRRVSYPGGIW